MLSVFGVVAICVILSFVGYGVKVAFSPVKGVGDTIIKNNDADNRIRSQAEFEKMYHGIIALDKNITVLAATAKSRPNDVIAQQSYQGTVLGCNQAVAAYNAEARKITSKDWKSADLPHEIDDTNPTTDCKGTES